MFQYPNDFCLFEIGSFDETSGLLAASVPPYSHGLAITLKKVAPVLNHSIPVGTPRLDKEIQAGSPDRGQHTNPEMNAEGVQKIKEILMANAASQKAMN